MTLRSRAAYTFPMRLANRARLSPAEHTALERELSGQHTLWQVVTWGRAQQPPLLVADVVAQDEFTRDVVVPRADGSVLVYGAT